jgi:hypothetical protein
MKRNHVWRLRRLEQAAVIRDDTNQEADHGLLILEELRTLQEVLAGSGLTESLIDAALIDAAKGIAATREATNGNMENAP